MTQETREAGSGVLFALREELDRWLGTVRGGNGTWSPATDMYMDEGELYIEVELPGVDGSDVEILTDGHELTIRALSSDPKTPRSASLTERRRGTYERKLNIPSEMNPTAAKADLREGVLTLRIPRAVETETTRRIELGRALGSSTVQSTPVAPPAPAAPAAPAASPTVPVGAQPINPANGNNAPKPNPAFLVPTGAGVGDKDKPK